MGSQLKKLRRALPPPPKPANRAVTVTWPGQRGIARYTFSVDGAPAPRSGVDSSVTVTAPHGVEVGPVEVIATPGTNAPTAPSEAFKPTEPAMRARPRGNELATLLALSMLAGLSVGPGRDRG